MSEKSFKLLEVDLTTKRINVVDVTEEMRKYLGGRGLGAKLLWDRVPPGTDPFSPENILYFGVGPITGCLGSVVNVSAKSPLTLLRGQSNMNGHLGAELIYAGYNAGILVTGKAEKPVYLYVKDSDVQIRDATHLWGKLVVETQVTLGEEIKKDLDDQNFRIASIGPAGEHLVRNAAICHDVYHFAARLGMGAVMGSKNLKAIAVRGTGSSQYTDPAKLFQMTQTFFHDGRLYKASNRRWGHTISIPQRFYEGREGIKNKQLGWHEICDLSNPVRLEQQFKLWNDGCTLCPTGCKVPYLRRHPPLGPCAGELRHDSAGGWNANVMIPGYDTQVYLTPFVGNLGFDSEDVSGVVAWVMECYDRGLVTRDDLDGIDLSWGNLEAICKLLVKIAYREGIGDILADGLKFAPEKLGKELRRYAMTNKGVAITSYEPRGSMLEAVLLALNPVGELHADRGTPDRVIFDSLTACAFLRPPIRNVFGDIAQWGVEMLGAACGWNLEIKDWHDLAHRASIMERCLCLREGYVPDRDDVLPDRFFDEEISTKYGKVLKLDRDTFREQLEAWYTALRLEKDGMPSKETLHMLGLDFAIPTVEKVRQQWG
ncbi:aldehyde ferredoxin oxidoreductase family protein [Chloroflexota bacterium]